MPSRYPSIGALPREGGVFFRVWAPTLHELTVVFDSQGTARRMAGDGAGYFEAFEAGIKPGTLYRYRFDERSAYPDPASRFQPQGVHGPSMVIDLSSYRWQDDGWRGIAQEDLVFYELHVGTFTPEGTFAATRRRLPHLKDLGITAIELMPVADFPGRWNWGYDGAALFAPARAYGTPNDLQALVDEAHQLGLAVFLDVVYNHFGPDGAYAPAFNPYFFSKRHRTPWGPAVNLDDDGAQGVRAFFIENALQWLVEYHFDGLRLDAIHALVDDSRTPFLLELSRAVHELEGPKRFLIAEDHRNLNQVVRSSEEGGYGLDGTWSDDYHHQLRRIIAGDSDGYFVDFTGSVLDLATILRQGWLFTGQYSRYFGAPRGTDPRGVPLTRFAHFIQNHDQVGNRPQGERITEAVPLSTFRAASALLLFAPELPLLFMGQEWAAQTPFCYFTDHHPELGHLITEGRKREFRSFAGFQRETPDPQDQETFYRSKLKWSEPEQEPHAGILRLYRDLLALRPKLKGEFTLEIPVEGSLLLRRGRYILLVTLQSGLTLRFPRGSRPILDTEDQRYALDPNPLRISEGAVFFPRPAALVVKTREE